MAHNKEIVDLDGNTNQLFLGYSEKKGQVYSVAD
jgi:hypothetical protein